MDTVINTTRRVDEVFRTAFLASDIRDRANPGLDIEAPRVDGGCVGVRWHGGGPDIWKPKTAG